MTLSTFENEEALSTMENPLINITLCDDDIAMDINNKLNSNSHNTKVPIITIETLDTLERMLDCNEFASTNTCESIKMENQNTYECEVPSCSKMVSNDDNEQEQQNHNILQLPPLMQTTATHRRHYRCAAKNNKTNILSLRPNQNHIENNRSSYSVGVKHEILRRLSTNSNLNNNNHHQIENKENYIFSRQQQQQNDAVINNQEEILNMQKEQRQQRQRERSKKLSFVRRISVANLRECFCKYCFNQHNNNNKTIINDNDTNDGGRRRKHSMSALADYVFCELRSVLAKVRRKV
jgi:hypothetical protein